MAAQLPPIPPLPGDRFPDAKVADPFARALIRDVSPGDLARAFDSDPTLLPAVLRNLGTAAMTNEQVGTYIRAVVRASAAAEVPRIVTLIVLDPLRYGEDAAFRKRINRWMPATIATLPAAKARAVIEELTRSAALDYDTAERSAVAAHLVARDSASRRVAFDAQRLHMPDDISGPIEASIYSLDRVFFTDEEVERFLAAVHAASPKRKLIVLGRTIDTLGRAFTPWPRDPFLIARTSAGGIVFVNRPNAQPHREEDQNMARAIIAGAPIDAKWTVAPLPFHNGHILLTPSTVWISMHSVETRAMELSGGPNTDPLIDTRYFDSVRRAARELEDFYHRPVRFVHPLSANLDDLLGGAGFDLDSIVTLLPHAALVGDINLGIALARHADWREVQRQYPLRGTPDDYLAAQSAPRTRALQQFLDIVAAELQRDGLKVRRLPLLNIPTSFVAREDVPQDKDFLITWNNVVLEGDRAEGFASLLPSIDDDVTKRFAESGVRLTLFPPLTHSIVLGGGYRCASNHLRPSPRRSGERVAEGR